MSDKAVHGRRYPLSVMRRAVMLRKAGWSIERVRDLIERETGTRPSKATIGRWTERPSTTEARRAYARRFQGAERARKAVLGFPRRTPEWRLARLRALHDAGLTCAVIATVYRVDFGDELTPDEIAAALRDNQPPRRLLEAA